MLCNIYHMETGTCHFGRLRVRLRYLMLAFVVSVIVIPSLRCRVLPIYCAIPEYKPSMYSTWRLALNHDSQKQGVHNYHNLEVAKKPETVQSYHEALRSRADKNGVIFLMSTDSGFIEMALNLYYSSLKKLNIANYLFVSSDAEASRVLSENGIAHFTFSNESKPENSSDWGTSEFVRKTHIKTEIILKALQYGFTVLIVDVDIVFIKNPLPYFSCTECDIQIQSDEVEGNSGFYMARPTKAAIALHAVALELAQHAPKLSNQKTIGQTMERMKIQGKLKYTTLPVSQFPNGRAYFETGHRMFAGDSPCRSCVIVHNNWIVSRAAKQYRFKEHSMWKIDKSGYYSSPSRKYLSYHNPFDYGKTTTTSTELDALKAALVIGRLVNRTVILPQFHCYGCIYASCKTPNLTRINMPHCSLNTHIRISVFDKVFQNSYREHVFLKHPYVPKETICSKSPRILIRTDKVLLKLGFNYVKDIQLQFTPVDQSKGATSAEVLKWFKPLSHFKILRFHSLYNAFGRFDPEHGDCGLNAALRDGFKKADYRQYYE